jgi:hypothetical protein
MIAGWFASGQKLGAISDCRNKFPDAKGTAGNL